MSPRPHITSPDGPKGTLTVQWEFLVMENPDQPIPMYMVLGNQAEIVLTNRVDGPVHFEFEGTVVLPLAGG